MSQIAVTTNGTIDVAGATVTGAADAHTALADFSDATYITKVANSATSTKFNLTTGTKPVNARTKAVRVWLRRSSATASEARFTYWVVLRGRILFRGQTRISGTTAVDHTSQYFNPGDLTQADVDALQFHVVTDSGSPASGRIYRVQIDVVFAELPSITATGPTGTDTNATVTGTWTFTPGIDGGPQKRWEAKVFNSTQYGSSGFTPGDTEAVWESGEVRSGAGSVDVTDLMPGTYRFYVRGAQNINNLPHWSSWSFSGFTVSYTPPKVSSLSTSFDGTYAGIPVTVNRDTSGPAWTNVEVERLDLDEKLTFDEANMNGAVAGGLAAPWGWGFSATPTSSQLSIVSSQIGWGPHQRLAATLDAGDSLYIKRVAPITVKGGKWVTLSMSARPGSTWPATVGVRLLVSYVLKDHTTTLRWVDLPQNAFDTGDRYMFSTKNPDDVSSATFQIGIVGLTGAVAQVASIDLDQVSFGESDGIWRAVRNARDVIPDTNSVVIDDYEAPPNTTLVYRARALDLTVSDYAGVWVYGGSGTSWELTSGVWFKSTLDHTNNIKLRLRVPPNNDREAETGRFAVLGSGYNVSVSDVRQGRALVWQVVTYTEEERERLRAVCDSPSILIQPAPVYHQEHGYFDASQLREVYPFNKVGYQERYFEIDSVEVAS